MSTDLSEKKNQNSVLLVGLAFLVALQMIPFLNHFNLLPYRLMQSKFIIRCSQPMFYFLFRLLYVGVVIALMSMFISVKLIKKVKKSEQSSYRFWYYLLSVLVLIGTIQHQMFFFYNIILFPIILFVHLFVASRGFAKLGEEFVEDKPFSSLNQKKVDDWCLIYNTDKGKLHVHNPFQGILVEGGAGAGKSASVIEPAIMQWIDKGISMTIYDFKGDPPTLGLTAYNAFIDNTNQNKLQFGLVSFNNEYLHLSERPNIFDPTILKSSIDTQSVLYTFLYGLNPEWRGKKDFWSQSATSAALGIVERLRRNPEFHPYCTLPHFIVLASSDPIKLLGWLRQDTEVQRIIQPLLSNLDNNVMETLSNQMSSLQAPLNVLFSEELFWVFGAEPESQTTLNLNDKDNPKILSISNDPKRAEALSPAIGSLLKAIMRIVNVQGKHPHAFVVDELPTIYLDGISTLPATGRSNKIAVMLGIQDESQLKSAYNKEADVITSNLGNLFLGMTNNPVTAKKYADFLGTYQTVTNSQSVSDSSVSFSTSMKDKKVLQDSDIANQSAGHFVGKIADGNPAFFSVQMDYVDKEKKYNTWQNTINVLGPDESINSVFQSSEKQFANMFFSDLVKFNYQRILIECDMLINS